MALLSPAWTPPKVDFPRQEGMIVVSGRIVDEDGRGVEGVRVYFHYVPPWQPPLGDRPQWRPKPHDGLTPVFAEPQEP